VNTLVHAIAPPGAPPPLPVEVLLVDEVDDVVVDDVEVPLVVDDVVLLVVEDEVVVLFVIEDVVVDVEPPVPPVPPVPPPVSSPHEGAAAMATRPPIAAHAIKRSIEDRSIEPPLLPMRIKALSFGVRRA
jgi:hypothetical protein